MSEISSFIAGMPKAELHVHLEGTLEPGLKFQLAARNRMDLSYRSAAGMRAAYTFDQPAMAWQGQACQANRASHSR